MPVAMGLCSEKCHSDAKSLCLEEQMLKVDHADLRDFFQGPKIFNLPRYNPSIWNDFCAIQTRETFHPLELSHRALVAN